MNCRALSVLPVALLLITTACRREQMAPVQPRPKRVAAVEELQLPDMIGRGAQPFLFAMRDGSLLLSWVEKDESTPTATLKLARMTDERWSEPATIVRRDDLFVNWADFPSVIEASDGTLFAHWLQKSGPSTYAYDVMIARSSDRGMTWSVPVKLHDDAVRSEHGFVSLVAQPSEPAVSAVWLDGRNMKEGEDHEGHGDMTLRYATIRSDGSIADRAELEPRTCECCTTAMAWSDEGPVVAYRDRSADEIRDIAIVRKKASGWTTPQVLHADGWKIDGCPVNGPQLDARGKDVAVAWFTGAGDRGQVHVAFSTDGGVTFMPPLRIDGNTPTGRVDVLLSHDGDAIATWIDGAGKEAAIVARRIRRNGKLGETVTVAQSSTARSAGFPRMALLGEVVYLAWTEFTPVKHVRMARLQL